MLKINYFQLIFLLIFMNYTESLLFEGSPTINLIASISIQLSELLPGRIFFMDWCLQASFELPAKFSHLYNSPIWPYLDSYRHNKDNCKRHVRSNENSKFSQKIMKPDKFNLTGYYGRHQNDFSAGELYQSIENLLTSYGFHGTCLLRSVCELSRHPFGDNDKDIYNQIITFILTPSLHMGFNADEQHYKDVYESAELYGFLGKNCEHIYQDCKHNILEYISNINF